jgi:hypothetical protein
VNGGEKIMATFLMKKRWGPGSQKENPKTPDDPKDSSPVLANVTTNDDDEDDNPLLGQTLGDARKRTPPRFRLRAMTASSSNNGTIGTRNTPSSQSSTGAATTPTFRDKFNSLLVKRENPSNSGNKISLITPRSRATTNDDDDDEPSTATPIRLDFQSLDGEEDDDDNDQDYDRTSSPSSSSPSSSQNLPISTIPRLHKESVDSSTGTGSQGPVVTDESGTCLESTEQHDWDIRQSFSTVNSDVFLNVSQDVSDYNLAIRFQDVIQLEISNESTLRSIEGNAPMMEIPYSPTTTDDQIQQQQEEQENLVDWAAAFEASWTGFEFSDSGHPAPVETADKRTCEDTNLAPFESLEKDQEAAYEQVQEPWTDLSASSPPLASTNIPFESPFPPNQDFALELLSPRQTSKDSQAEPIVTATHEFPLDSVTKEMRPVDAVPTEPTETTVSSHPCHVLAEFGVPNNNAHYEVMTPKTPMMEMNMAYMSSDILRGPPRQRSSFAEVPSLSPQTPHLENGFMTYSYTGIIYGPVQLPSMQCFENHIQKLDLTEEDEPNETATTKVEEIHMDASPEHVTVHSMRKGKPARDLPPMPALS